MKRKRMNNAGFTLIELLAVITIMGILMMVAIPSVTRTIENSRRDSFNTIAKSYMDAVRNAWVSDNIECYYNSTWTVASGVAGSSTGEGAVYYFPICTAATAASGNNAGCVAYGTTLPIDRIKTSTLDLMESGGLSSFGNGDIYGVVKVNKLDTSDTNAHTKIKYTIKIGDTGKHGYDGFYTDKELKRSAVNTSQTAGVTSAPTGAGTTNSVTANMCRLS